MDSYLLCRSLTASVFSASATCRAISRLVSFVFSKPWRPATWKECDLSSKSKWLLVAWTLKLILNSNSWANKTEKQPHHCDIITCCIILRHFVMFFASMRGRLSKIVAGSAAESCESNSSSRRLNTTCNVVFGRKEWGAKKPKSQSGKPHLELILAPDQDLTGQGWSRMVKRRNCGNLTRVFSPVSAQFWSRFTSFSLHPMT